MASTSQKIDEGTVRICQGCLVRLGRLVRVRGKVFYYCNTCWREKK